MGYGPNIFTTFLVVATVCVLLPQAHAFGAGDIPDFAYLNEKAFRHGDIESVLEKLAKTAGRASINSSSLLGFATSVVSAATGPKKFSKNDIKKVYFGNWLRDYSQAMDIAGLSKLSADTLVLVVSVLAFMTFGFSTEEFKVTADRLGVYLPVEHIDNPKGYAQKEGDARSYHPNLRPPVEDVELEIDENTGMKKYMASDNQGFDTSTAFIRRTLKSCIEYGRRAQGREGDDLWEAYRLLGTGLHTLEDFTAHSNWCEIALRKMGYHDVFCHVGDEVIVDTPNGPAPPLVTGTFGGADFLHSLLGEAGDKLSQASVTDLSGKLSEAQQNQNPDIGKLKTLLDAVMGGDSNSSLEEGQHIQEASQGYHFDPDNVAPPEVQKQLLDLLKWHDDVMRNVIKKISMVPGLETMLEEFSNALNAFIYTTLAPYLTPILSQATQALDEGSKAVIDNDDQYEVFDNPHASDPSHSLLSKDHFGLILNEPAGQIAQIIVEHTVNIIVQAWSDDSDPDAALDKVLEAFHHPYYSSNRSDIQRKMFQHMQNWIGGLGDDADRTIEALSKESVRDHKNKRLGSEDQSFDEPGYGSCGHGHGSTSGKYDKKPTTQTSKPSKPSYGAEAAGAAVAGGAAASYYSGSSGGRPSQAQAQSGAYGTGRQEQASYGGRQDTPSYGGRQDSSTYGGRQDNSSYGGRQDSSNYAGRQDSKPAYGGRQDTPSYGGRQDAPSYGGRQDTPSYGGRQETPSYGGRQDTPSYGGRQETPSYGGRQDAPSYGGRQETPSYGGRQDASSYGRQESVGYGGGRQETQSYSGRQEAPSYGGGPDNSGYGGRQEAPSYGGRQDNTYGGRQEAPSYGSRQEAPSYGGRQDVPSYGGGRKKDDDDDDKRRRDNRKDSDDKHQYGGGYGGSRRDDDEKPKYGGGYGGSRREDDDEDDRKPKYGGGSRRDDDDKPKYGGGSRRDDDDDDDRKPKYGGGGGYGGGSSRRGDDDKPKKYGQDDSDDEKKRRKAGKKSKDDDSDEDSRKKKGYAPSYGGNQTFGAERMKIRDDSDDDSRKNKYGGGGRRY